MGLKKKPQNTLKNWRWEKMCLLLKSLANSWSSAIKGSYTKNEC